MAKIVTVYTSRHHKLISMSYIRWYKISEALARLGHQVDIAANEFVIWRWWRKKSPTPMGENLRRVPLSKVRWSGYDVVKTLYGEGFDNLEMYGGIDHPFIISRFGTVVGPQDMEGIYFYGKKRERSYLRQKKINQTSKYVTVLNESAKELWTTCFGPRDNILIVPGAVDGSVPPPSEDPYPKEHKIRCIFAGNVFYRNYAPEANTALIDKLNKLGKLLFSRGAKLYVIGPGDAGQLDKRYVAYLGVVSYDESWNYFHFAHVGVELVKGGRFMHNNESSKVYHYLRVGLPVVSEEGLPNNSLIEESKLGFVIENSNLELMAQKIEEAADKDWNRDYAINYILNNHTWDKRAEIYDRIIKENFEK
ncbi:MAG: hypothetical protein ACRENW_00240 [Thermodesulfobacteriota bacterium]